MQCIQCKPTSQRVFVHILVKQPAAEPAGTHGCVCVLHMLWKGEQGLGAVLLQLRPAIVNFPPTTAGNLSSNTSGRPVPAALFEA